MARKYFKEFYMFDEKLIGFLINLAWITGVVIGVIGGVIGTYCSLKSAKTKKQRKRVIICSLVIFVFVSLILIAVWFGSSYIRYGTLVVISMFGIFGQPILKFLIQSIAQTFEEDQV